MSQKKNNCSEKESKGLSTTGIIVIIIGIAAVIAGGYVIFSREEDSEGAGPGSSSGQGNSDGEVISSDTFPSKIGQRLTYVSSKSNLSVEVIGENTVLGKETFRVKASFDEKEVFVFVGKDGKVWRYEAPSVNQYYILNHNTGKYFKSSGENGDLPENYLIGIGPTPLIGAWWKDKNLYAGKTFDVVTCIEGSCTQNMVVKPSKKVTVPAGEFDTYKVEIEGGLTAYVDKDTGFLIKMKVSDRSLSLKTIEGF